METLPLDSIAERVAYLRDASGEDAAPLSVLCGLASSHVGMIVRGAVQSPATATLAAIAKTTGVDIGWLITGEGAPPSADAVREAVEAARERQRAATPATTPEPAAPPSSARVA